MVKKHPINSLWNVFLSFSLRAGWHLILVLVLFFIGIGMPPYCFLVEFSFQKNPEPPCVDHFDFFSFQMLFWSRVTQNTTIPSVMSMLMDPICLQRKLSNICDLFKIQILLNYFFENSLLCFQISILQINQVLWIMNRVRNEDFKILCSRGGWFLSYFWGKQHLNLHL